MFYAFSALVKVQLAYFITVSLVVERTTPRPVSDALIAKTNLSFLFDSQGEVETLELA